MKEKNEKPEKPEKPEKTEKTEITSNMPARESEKTTSNTKRKKKKTKPRCRVCRARVLAYMVPVMTCKCQQIFCGVHIHDHSCTHDFHADTQKLLQTQNPVVKPPRLRERL